MGPTSEIVDIPPSFQPITLDPPPERDSVDAQDIGGPVTVAARVFQDLGDVGGLVARQGSQFAAGWARWGGRRGQVTQALRQMAGLDPVAARQGHAALDQIRQFAHIAREVVMGQ